MNSKEETAVTSQQGFDEFFPWVKVVRQCNKSLLHVFPAAISEASPEGKGITEPLHWSIFILILSPFTMGQLQGDNDPKLQSTLEE